MLPWLLIDNQSCDFYKSQEGVDWFLRWVCVKFVNTVERFNFNGASTGISSYVVPILTLPSLFHWIAISGFHQRYELYRESLLQLLTFVSTYGT